MLYIRPYLLFLNIFSLYDYILCLLALVFKSKATHYRETLIEPSWPQVMLDLCWLPRLDTVRWHHPIRFNWNIFVANWQRAMYTDVIFSRIGSGLVWSCRSAATSTQVYTAYVADNLSTLSCVICGIIATASSCHGYKRRWNLLESCLIVIRPSNCPSCHVGLLSVGILITDAFSC